MKEVIGWMSIVLSASYMVPQLWKCYATASTKDISTTAFGVQFVSCTLFVVYNILDESWLMVTMGVINVVEILLMLIMCVVFREQDRGSTAQ